MSLENLQPLCYAVATVFFVIGTTTTLLRLYTRQFVIKAWGWDDWFACVMFFTNCGQQAILYLFLIFGCGLHIDTLTLPDIQKILECLFAEEIVYFFTHWVIKQTFLFFYLRLSKDRNFRRWVYVTFVLNFVILVINWLLAFFQCIPFGAILHPENFPDAVCINSIVLFLVPAILNLALDIMILVLPIHTIWSLQMSLKRKIGVISVMGLGGSSSLISALRLIVLYQLHASPDTSYILGRMIIIAALEVQFGVITVNMPAIAGLWRAKVSRSSASRSGGYSNGYAGHHKLQEFNNGHHDHMNSRSKPVSKTMESALDENGDNESQEELFIQSNQIKVTRDVTVESATGDAQSQRSYHFGGPQGNFSVLHQKR